MNDWKEKLKEEIVKKTWFHPWSAALMVALDFGGTLGDVSGVLLTFLMPLVMIGIFLSATAAVTLIQIRAGGDDLFVAFAKGFIAGILCAIPFPVFGTAVGSFILIKSGWDELKRGGKWTDIFRANKK